jgi:hypothetical protein
MRRFFIGAVALVAMAGIGCASESQERSSLRFAVVEPQGRCTTGGDARTIATDVREKDLEAAASKDGFAVRFTQKKNAKTHLVGSGAAFAQVATASIDEEWVTVDGTRLWRTLRPTQSIKAVKEGDRTAVALVSNGHLLAGVAGRGVLYGPLQDLGTVTTDDSMPDIVLHDGNAALTWEGPDGAHVAGFSNAQGWSAHTIPTPPEAHIMDPRVAPVAGNRFIVLWREGTVERHGLRAQLYNADARPVGGSFDPAPGMEVVRADVAAKPDGEVLVASLVATDKGLDLVASPVLCNAE